MLHSLNEIISILECNDKFHNCYEFKDQCHDAIVDENVIMEVLSSFLAGNNDAPVVEKIND